MQSLAIPYEGGEPYIFFSYSHKDAPKVYPILEQMVSDGFRVWYDDGNHPGDDWPENIAQHLDRSRVCVAMLSENFVNSHNCKSELTYSLQAGKALNAVLISSFAMPLGIKLQLSAIQYIRLEDHVSCADMLRKLYTTEAFRECHSTEPLPMREVRGEWGPGEFFADKDGAEAREVIRLQDMMGKREPQGDLLPEDAEPEGAESSPAEDQPRVKQPNRIRVRPKVVRHHETPAESAAECNAAEMMEMPEDKPAAELEPAAAAEYAEESAEQAEHAIPEESAMQQEEAPIELPAEDVKLSAELPEGWVAFDSMESVVVLDEEYEDDEDERTIVEYPVRTVVLIRLSDRSVYLLDREMIWIGRRASACEVAFTDNHYISGHHADILHYEGRYYLKDAGSTNGTFYMGQQLESNGQTELKSGSVFSLGRSGEERILFVSGPQATAAIRRESLAFLLNPETRGVRLLDHSGILLGRNHSWEDGTLASQDRKISRSHAQVTYQDGSYMLQDLNSANGTYLVAGEDRVVPGQNYPLKDGDQFRICDTVLEFGLVSLKK